MMKSGLLRRIRIPGLGLGLVVLSAAVALSQSKPAAGGAAEDKDSMSAFGKMIPVGYVNRNVTIPSFTKNAPSSLLKAETMTRLDDEHLAAEKVTVEIYGKTPADTLRVDLKTAIYHLTEKVLRSGERSKVTRHDFEMEGDSMVFDASSSIGGMKGRVRTLIFDMDTVSGKSEPTTQPSN